jgi:hypothetical protein
MSGRVGSITTGIITDGLVFNMDAANRASTIPSTSTLKTFNTIDTTISGSVITDSTWTDSTISPSFNFDGSDGYIDFSDNDIFSFGNSTTDSPFSISCWAYCVDATRFRTLSKATEWLHGGFGSNKLGLLLMDNNASNYIYRISNATISQNVWVNLVSTYNGSGANTGIKLYINGSEDSGTTGNAGSYTAMHNNSSILYVGRDSDFGNYFANGNIGSAQIYNRALSSTEVLHNYNALRDRFGV